MLRLEVQLKKFPCSWLASAGQAARRGLGPRQEVMGFTRIHAEEMALITTMDADFRGLVATVSFFDERENRGERDQ